ncbi:family 16 glycosylhydrolase [Flammeovirga sp. EKP202]|uniref:family 16 glycosylhydrolase n=1 Tax=Flammeovirga sp. EKP202 TaxID=2770592 RepID=UPI00165F171F|nr:family 16 glycosylhydrolase [Flammeovirga sp. EKP202]MBD0401768.1 family 16 glycosylhydrolase [Flammeovirga sp. EKP202]
MQQFFNIAVLLILMISCQKQLPQKANVGIEDEYQKIVPYSIHPTANEWTLDDRNSDEFQNGIIDTAKWFVQGSNNNYHLWKGDAPSQFFSKNIQLSKEQLIISSKWQPNSEFSKEKYNGKIYENVTTGGIVSKNKIKEGYIEIKAKVANSSIKSSFGIRNSLFELHLFDIVGRPRFYQYMERTPFLFSYYSINSTSPLHRTKLLSIPLLNKGNLTNAFHIYGFEWGRHYLKLFLDGQEIYSMKNTQFEIDWPISKEPFEIWVNASLAKEYGLPKENELPSLFVIEYIRIWRKENHKKSPLVKN